MANLNQALGTDLAALAKLLKSKGRGRDTVLAHITPQEAALLKRRGGRGSINPDTGLPEFEDTVDAPSPDVVPVDNAPAPVTDYSQPAPVEQAPVQQDQQVQPQTGGFDPFHIAGALAVVVKHIKVTQANQPHLMQLLLLAPLLLALAVEQVLILMLQALQLY